MRKASLLGGAAALLILAGCSSGGGSGGGGGGGGTSTPTPTPTGSTTSGGSTTTSSTSTGGATGAALNVEPCFAQTVSPGITVASLLTRDTLRLDMSKPNGFPNGRRLQDPVIDLTLAYVFIDLSRHELDSLAKLAINPATNADNFDAAGNVIGFKTDFPFVNDPHGPAKPEGTGSNFNFRTNPASDFEIIDAMGNPAVATALISQNVQPSFNQNTPAEYAAGNGKYLEQLKTNVTGLATLLKDDFERLSFTTCAK
jgi:hypothetical protein